MDLVKEDFTVSDLVEGEAVVVKVLGMTCAKYIPVALLPDTTGTDFEQAIEEMIEMDTEDPQEEEPETRIVFFDEVDSIYFMLSGEEFVDRHALKKQQQAKVEKPKAQKPKVKRQPAEERVKIKASVFSVPVFGASVDAKAANYALYAMMLENDDYEVVFYPQYETTKSGFLFFYTKTRVKAKARLGKLTE